MIVHGHEKVPTGGQLEVPTGGQIDLIILDELGFAPLDDIGIQLLFRLVTGAYERRSLAIAITLALRTMGPLPARTDHRGQHLGH
jgi:hypothetical protein